MLEVKCLSAGYPGRQVLKQVDLQIPSGSVTVILGPNGCGKSTLLKALCRIIPADSGQVLLHNENLLLLPQQRLARKVAYLAQSRQIPDITVERLVLHGRFPYLGYPRRYRKEDHSAAEAAMEAMGIRELAGELLQNLSGGQRQKVYIAMALAQDTPVVLLDEPTTYLDISHQLQLMQQARQLAAQGKTVIMIIHDLPHAFQAADHMILMQDGRIAAEGTPEEIYTSAMISSVFGVRLGRTGTAGSWKYYWEEGTV